MHLTSYSKGRKTLGLCSFVANFSQAFMRPLVRRYTPLKVSSALLLLVLSFYASAFAIESQLSEVRVGDYACSLQFQLRVLENSTVPNDYQSTVGLYYSFFKKRPSAEIEDSQFYGRDHDGLLHAINILPSYGAEKHDISVKSVRISIEGDILYLEKAFDFDPTLPVFVLAVEHVDRVYSQIKNDKPLEYVYTYSNGSELKHTPEIRDLKVYSKMFETCMDTAE